MQRIVVLLMFASVMWAACDGSINRSAGSLDARAAVDSALYADAWRSADADTVRPDSVAPICAAEEAGEPFPGDFAAWWRFNSGAEDEAGQYDGVMHGGTIVRDPVRGSVLELNGIDQYVATEHDTKGLTAITVAAWFRAAASQKAYAAVVAEAGYNGKVIGWTMRHMGGVFGLQSGDGEAQHYAPAARLDDVVDTWHHLAFSWDGANVTTYLDGHLVEQTAAEFADASSMTTIGWSNLNNEDAYFSGKIDDVIIYHRALDAEEVATLAARCGNGICENHEPQSCVEDCGAEVLQCALSDGHVFNFTADGRWRITDCAGLVFYAGKPLLKYMDGESERETTDAVARTYNKQPNGAAVQFDFVGQFEVKAHAKCLQEGVQVNYRVASTQGSNLLYLDPHFGARVREPTLAAQWKVSQKTAVNFHYPRSTYGGAYYEIFAPAIHSTAVRGAALVTGYDLHEGDIFFGEEIKLAVGGNNRTLSLPLAKFRAAHKQFIFSCETCTDPAERCDYSEERTAYFDHGNYLPSTEVSGTYYFDSAAQPHFDGYYKWFAEKEFRSKNWAKLNPEPPRTVLMGWSPSKFANAFAELGEFPDMMWTVGAHELQPLLDAGADPNRLFMKAPSFRWQVVSPAQVMPDGTANAITESMLARNPDGTPYTGRSKHACGVGWTDSYNAAIFYNHASHGALDAYFTTLEDNWYPQVSGRVIGSDGPEFYSDYNPALRATDRSMRKGFLELLGRLNANGFIPLCNPAWERDIHSWKYLEFLEYEYLFTRAVRDVEYWTPHFIDSTRYGDQVLVDPAAASKRADKYVAVAPLLSALPNAPLRFVFYALLGFSDTDAHYAYQLAFTKQLPHAIMSVGFGSGGVGKNYCSYETSHYALNQRYVPAIESSDFRIAGANRTVPFGHSVRLLVDDTKTVTIQTGATHYQFDSQPVKQVTDQRISETLAAGEHTLRVWSAQDGFIVDVERLDSEIAFVLGRPFVGKAVASKKGYTLYAIMGDFARDANISDLRANEDQGGTDGLLHRWRDVDRTRIRYEWASADSQLTINVMLGEAKPAEKVEFLWDGARYGQPQIISGDIDSLEYNSLTGVGAVTVSNSGAVVLGQTNP